MKNEIGQMTIFYFIDLTRFNLPVHQTIDKITSTRGQRSNTIRCGFGDMQFPDIAGVTNNSFNLSRGDNYCDLVKKSLSGMDIPAAGMFAVIIVSLVKSIDLILSSCCPLTPDARETRRVCFGTAQFSKDHFVDKQLKTG